MNAAALLQVAEELRKRAAATAADGERADLLFLAQEYETVARSGIADKAGEFFVNLPK